MMIFRANRFHSQFTYSRIILVNLLQYTTILGVQRIIRQFIKFGCKFTTKNAHTQEKHVFIP